MNDRMLTDAAPSEWEYGFYEGATPGGGPTYWYAFGGLVNFPTLESAQHTAVKSLDDPIYVRRVKGQTVWEPVKEES